jgi:transposase-like protein
VDPTTAFCPNMDCPTRGQAGKGNLGVHSRQDKRGRCRVCGKTFAAPRGTAFYRLRTPAELMALVVTLIAHGCPPQAMVAAFGFDERTVADWLARTGRQSRAVHEHLVEQPRDLGQVQADELRVKAQGRILWMAMALMVSTRLWLGGEVSPHRDLSLIRRLVQHVRACALMRCILLCTDGLCSYVRAARETFRVPRHDGQRGRPRLRVWPQVLIAQGVKRYEKRRVVDVERRVVQGTVARVEKALVASQGKGVINTAYIERLNATFRARLASLTRRGRALARKRVTLEYRMYLIGAVYNFCTVHESLRVAATVSQPAVPRTPAMAARITAHCWSLPELLSFHVPPPRWMPPRRRGRRSRALQLIIAQWCSGPRLTVELPFLR